MGYERKNQKRKQETKTVLSALDAVRSDMCHLIKGLKFKFGIPIRRRDRLKSEISARLRAVFTSVVDNDLWRLTELLVIAYSNSERKAYSLE